MPNLKPIYFLDQYQRLELMDYVKVLFSPQNTGTNIVSSCH